MRVLICSLNKLFGQCLSRGLAEQPGIEFTRSCSEIDEIPFLAERHGVTSVLIDLGGAGGGEALRAVTRLCPDLCVLALSVDDSAAAEVVECARLGCAGFVPKNASLKDVVRIIRAATRGEVTLSPSVAAQLMHALADAPVADPHDLPECLTRREKEICSLIFEGMTNKEIAREVNRSVGTVKNHVSSILSKLDVPRRSAIYNQIQHDTPRLLRAH